MSTSSFRVGLSSLAVLVSIVVLWPVIGHAEPTQAPSTESSAGGVIDGWLVARGLIGRGMVGEQSGLNAMTPPFGVEVDETRQTENRTGQLVMQAKSWNETIGDDTVHIDVIITFWPAISSKSASGYFPIVGRAAPCINGRCMIMVARCRARSGATTRRCYGWPGPSTCHMTCIPTRFRGSRFCAPSKRRKPAPKVYSISR